MTTTADPGDLEPIETASADELRALQLERLQWSLRHAYENVPYYRQVFDAAGVHPDDCKDLSDLAEFPFTTKASLRDNYPFGMFAVPREQVVAHPRLLGHHRAAHGRRLHPRRHRHLGHRDGALDPRRGRPPGAHPAQRLRLRAVHRRHGRPLRRREARLHRGAGLGRHDRAAGDADPGLPPDVIMVTPSYMLAILDEMERQGLDPARCSLKFGIFGAEPWTNEMRAEIEARAGHRRHRHLRPVGGHRARGRPGVRGDQGRPARLGGPLLPRGHRPGHRHGAARRRAGRAGLHLAHQAGHARHPLPDPRPDPAAARDRAHDAPDGEDHRPYRRHDHPARRQPVPDPDRGADPARARPSRRTSSCTCPAPAGWTP